MGLALLCISNLAGCGVTVDGGGEEEELLVGGDAQLPEVRYVVLDWSAESYQMLTAEPAPPIDLSLFELEDGGTLADLPDFAELLAARMQAIFEALEPADIRVLPSDDGSLMAQARVLMTQGRDPNDVKRIGQAYYDPCDVRVGDEAVIWGQAMIDLGAVHSLEEWVHLFANTAAHEAAHTLGFNHPDVVGAEAGRILPTDELMLSKHDLASLLRPQSFQIPQDTCSVELGPGDGEIYTVQATSEDTTEALAASDSSPHFSR